MLSLYLQAEFDIWGPCSLEDFNICCPCSLEGRDGGELERTAGLKTLSFNLGSDLVPMQLIPEGHRADRPGSRYLQLLRILGALLPADRSMSSQ